MPGLPDGLGAAQLQTPVGCVAGVWVRLVWGGVWAPGVAIWLESLPTCLVGWGSTPIHLPCGPGEHQRR